MHADRQTNGLDMELCRHADRNADMKISRHAMCVLTCILTCTHAYVHACMQRICCEDHSKYRAVPGSS